MSALPVKKLKPLLKLLLSAALLWLVLRSIDISRMTAALRGADAFWLLVAFLLFNLSKIVSALRLNLYFHAIGIALSQRANLALYYVGMFYNLFLPGGIGGDGYKVYRLARRYARPVGPIVQAVLLDRVSGLAGLIFFACLLFAAGRNLPLQNGWTLAAAWVGAAAVFPVMWLGYRYFFPRFLAVFRTTTLWGVAVQALQLLSALAIAFALGIDHALVLYLTLFLVSSVAATLPLTIGGVGIREATFLYGLQAAHEPPDLGVTFSFLFFIITAFSSFMGFFLLKAPLRE